MIADQAFILHKRPYKDSSELIKLITRNHGILDVVAKGSLRPKSRIRGQLQPFILSEIQLMGKSSLKTLIDSNQNESFKKCAYKNHVSMLYCNELLTLVNLNEMASKRMFQVYQLVVSQLQSAKNLRLILRWFEWQLCIEMGYELIIPECAENIDWLGFDPVNGLSILTHKNNHQVNQFPCTVATLKAFTEHSVLDAINLNLPQLNELSKLMRYVINHLVNGKTIRSRQLLLGPTVKSH